MFNVANSMEYYVHTYTKDKISILTLTDQELCIISKTITKQQKKKKKKAKLLL